MAGCVHIVFCRSRTLLLKDPQAGWRQIQDQYEDYMASLGPWSETDFIEYFAIDYGEDDARWPFSRAALASFFANDDFMLELLEPSGD